MLVSFAVTSAAEAQSVERRTESVRFGALRGVATGPLALVSETVAIRCDDLDDRARCEVDAAITLRNDGEHELHYALGATAEGLASATLDDGHAPIPIEPTAPRLEGELPVGATVVIHLRGAALLVGGRANPIRDALTNRHIALATPLSHARGHLTYVRTTRDIVEHLEHPASLTFESAGELHATLVDRGSSTSLTSAAHPASAAAVDVLLERGSAPIVRHGGPVLMLGGTIDRGFRARLGYELGFGEFVIASVHGDIDANGRVVVAPELELALPGSFLPPSFGVGVGLPIGLHPVVDVGVRIDVSAVLGPIGVVLTLDYEPGPQSFSTTIFGRASL